MPNEPSNHWRDDSESFGGDGDGAWEDDGAFDDGMDEDGDDDGDGGRRARDTAYCPECGAEIYDAADICPACYSWIDGETTRRPPGNRRFRQGGAQLVVWMLIAALLAGAGLVWLARTLGSVANGS